MNVRNKATEELFAEIRRPFQVMFENALDGILVMDDDGHYVDANPAICELLGYTREEVLQLTAWDLTPEPNRKDIPEALKQFRAAGRLSGEYTLLCKDGSTRQVEFRSVANILPGLHMAVHRDITERKRAEEKLRRNESLLAEAQELAHVGSWNWDVTSDKVTWSDELFRIFGLEPQEEPMPLGRVLEMFHPDERQHIVEGIQQAFQHRPPADWSLRGLHSDGSIRFLHARGRVVFDAQDRPVRMFGTVQDVTEQRHAEEKAREYFERVQALSRRLLTVQEEERRHLARELHDEIGQILTGIKFAVEASASAPPDRASARLREARALINTALTHVRELSFDLRPALLDHLGLKPALDALIHRFTAATGVHVSFQHAGLDQRFGAETETAAYRIVQEALTNVARHAHVGEAAVRVWARGGTLWVQVEDEGQGFDAEAVLAAGRSSGLPGIHERASLLGGRARVEATPGGGTHLLAELPLNSSLERKSP